MIGGMAEGGDQGRATRPRDVVVTCPDRLKVAAAVKCRQIIVTGCRTAVVARKLRRPTNNIATLGFKTYQILWHRCPQLWVSLFT
jgi:hypothetical protein